MKRGRVATAIISGLAATGAGLGVWAGTATATPGHAASARLSTAAAEAGRTARTPPLPPSVVFNCRHQGVTRPKTYVLSCADANNYLSHLSYVGWTPNAAAASGTQMKNDCKPSCVAGTVQSYPADVIFWRPEPLGHPKNPTKEYFTRITVVYPGAHPPIWVNQQMIAGPQTWTATLPGY